MVHSAPLSQYHNNAARPWYRDHGMLRLNMWILSIMVAQVTDGYDASLMGGIQAVPLWKVDMGRPNSKLLGVVVAGFFIGGVLCSIPSAILTDRLGRVWALRLGAIICTIGGILTTAATGAPMFLVGRIVLGMGQAFNICGGPILVNELAHPRQRGQVAATFNVLWYVGSIIASWTIFGTKHIQGSHWSWRTPCLIQCVPSIFVFLATWSGMPESPRWLISKGRRDEALKLLAYYHANADENDEMLKFEMAEIENTLAHESAMAKTGWSEMWRTRANLKRVALAAFLNFFCIWSGQGVITYYLVPMLNLIGITNANAQTGLNGGIAIWNFLVSVLGAKLADNFGRRKLWLTSAFGMILANVGTIAANSQYAHTKAQAPAIAAIVLIFLYNGAYNIACTPLIYAHPVEIMPFLLRSKAKAVTTIVAQGSLVTTSYVNSIALGAIQWRWFAFYLGILVINTCIMYLYVPETKGLTLEEIANIFEPGSVDVQAAAEAAVQDRDIEKAADVLTPSEDKKLEEGSLSDAPDLVELRR